MRWQEFNLVVWSRNGCHIWWNLSDHPDNSNQFFFYMQGMWTFSKPDVKRWGSDLLPKFQNASFSNDFTSILIFTLSLVVTFSSGWQLKSTKLPSINDCGLCLLPQRDQMILCSPLFLWNLRKNTFPLVIWNHHSLLFVLYWRLERQGRPRERGGAGISNYLRPGSGHPIISLCYNCPSCRRITISVEESAIKCCIVRQEVRLATER